MSNERGGLISLIKFGLKSVFAFLSLAAVAYFTWIYVYPRLLQHESKISELHHIKKVYDGDTFQIESGEKIRLLGIDSPEKWQSRKLDKDAERTGRDKKTLQKLGELASEYAENLLNGKKVKLLPEPNYQDKDGYGRLLRYVYLEDGTFINKKIVEDGYAYAYRQYKISKLDELINAEREARTNRRGLWGRVDGLKQLE